MFARRSKTECVTSTPLFARGRAGWRGSLRSCRILVALVAIGVLGIAGSPAQAGGFGVVSPGPAYYVGYYPYPGIWHGWHHRHWSWYAPYGYLDPFDYPFGPWDYPW